MPRLPRPARALARLSILALLACAAPARAQYVTADEVIFRSGCEATECGNSAVEDYETCDDGGAATGDGCDERCLVEHGFVCSLEAPSACVTVCGDGIEAGDEQCDDGGSSDGDGCSASCTVEPGFQCEGAPSVCATDCGDGILAGVEQCDDGGTENFDGCSAACTRELGYQCSGVPSACTFVVGLDCETVPSPPGPSFSRQEVPATWSELTGAALFPDFNLSSPARVVPAAVFAGLTFLGSSLSRYTAVEFTTKASPWFSSDIQFDVSQIPGTNGAEPGEYFLSVTRCPGDFRAFIAEPREATDSPACRSGWVAPGQPYFVKQEVRTNASGVSDDTVFGECGLVPGHTYFLNYINADPANGISPGEHTCPNNANQCGVHMRIQ